jgi:hypothetical protein
MVSPKVGMGEMDGIGDWALFLFVQEIIASVPIKTKNRFFRIPLYCFQEITTFIVSIRAIDVTILR